MNLCRDAFRRGLDGAACGLAFRCLVCGSRLRRLRSLISGVLIFLHLNRIGLRWVGDILGCRIDWHGILTSAGVGSIRLLRGRINDGQHADLRGIRGRIGNVFSNREFVLIAGPAKVFMGRRRLGE